MSLVRLILNSDLSADGFKSVCDLSPGQLPALNNFIDYCGGLSGGNYMGLMEFDVGAVQASGSLRCAAGGSTAAQACTVLNVTLTAIDPGTPSMNQFVVSATAATQAQNMVDAINSSTDLNTKVVATRVNGDVVITSLVPGVMGNGLQLSAGNLSNVTVQSAFSGGSDGTSYDLDLR